MASISRITLPMTGDNDGRDGGIRTPNLPHVAQTLFRSSYAPSFQRRPDFIVRTPGYFKLASLCSRIRIKMWKNFVPLPSRWMADAWRRRGASPSHPAFSLAGDALSIRVCAPHIWRIIWLGAEPGPEARQLTFFRFAPQFCGINLNVSPKEANVLIPEGKRALNDSAQLG